MNSLPSRTVTFEHLTFNTGHVTKITEHELDTDALKPFEGLENPGLHHLPLDSPMLAGLSVLMTRHSAKHYTFSILRRVPIVICHACLDDDAVDDVWQHALTAHCSGLSPRHLAELPQHITRFLVETPLLRKPHGKFLSSHLVLLDPCISWIAAFDQCLYWHLWNCYEQRLARDPIKR